MKWQQRVRVATGLSCWQIMLHLLVVAVLVMGWMSGALVRVGLGLCVLYSVTLLAMLFLQRHHEARWRDVGDFLEELTTTWYFGAAMIALWLLSRGAAQQPAAGPRRAGDTGRPGGGLAAGER
ncbi:membrane protein [Klebsiella pneumoniae]|uniref:Membrane protein n=1 Tax=Klebsiella pneumoniae TaxID=573 RepID=A0A378F754_KLEPN|nr:membrane protein [Klebsiella pneumoniae]